MILKSILDLVFPKTCLSCEKDGDYLCLQCEKKIDFLSQQVCPNCRKICAFGKFCSRKCAGGFWFDQLVVCCNYEKEGLLKKLLVLMKYKFAEEVAEIFGKIMKYQLAHFSHEFLGGPVVFIPVPLHKKRLDYRGFNQALLLARFLSQSFRKIEVLDCLYRRSFKKTQVQASWEERIHNLDDSFGVKLEYSELLRGKTVILVDDIATTGSTLNECSKVLKNAGVKYVCGLVLARGKFSW